MRRAIWCAILACLASMSAVSAQASSVRDHSSIVILGDGTPLLSADRSGTSIGVVVRGTLYIFDAGPGVLRRIMETRERLGLGIQRIGPVFLTHLHSDHTLGLPELLYDPSAPPLRVYGPTGTQSMLDRIQSAWSEDLKIRSTSGMPSDQALAATVSAATAREIAAGVAFKDSNITVTAFEVSHGTWPHAFGYRIVTPDRIIVISGDTRPSESVVQACNGCDVLLHAVYNGENTLSAADLAYFTRFHTSTKELAALATRARPGLLILYHQVFMGKSRADLIRQVGIGFRGPVISARDLDVF
jgi:ribonuclease BN (tRNA processing enzyme)